MMSRWKRKERRKVKEGVALNASLRMRVRERFRHNRLSILGEKEGEPGKVHAEKIKPSHRYEGTAERMGEWSKFRGLPLLTKKRH